MKLRKLLAVTAVAATMTAAFAVNAMAETTNNLVSGTDFTYDAEKGIITLTTDKQPSAAPYTMLVVASDEDDLDKTIADTDIKQIDQADAAFTTITVGTLAEGTYEIRLGGDGDVRWGTLEVKAASNPNYDDGTRKVGDVNGNGEIAVNDSGDLLKYLAYGGTVTKDQLQSMDINDNGEIAVNDSGDLLKYLAYGGDLGTLADKTKFVEIAE